MAIYALNHKKVGNFVKIHKPFLLDPTLSETAKTVLSIALCYKSNKNVNPHMLNDHMAAGPTAIYSAIRLLEERGYVHVHQGRFNGKFTTTTYDYYESPALNPYYQKGFCGEPVTTVPANDDPDPVLPHTDYPHAVNRHGNNTYRDNKKKNNNRKDNNIDISNNINQSNHPNINTGEIDAMEQAIKKQIDYDNLQDKWPYCYLDDITQTMLSVMVQDSDYIPVSKDVTYPSAYVRYVLSKINPLHVDMILTRLKEDNPTIKNMRGYLLTCLINAATNMETSYQYGDY